MSMDIFDFMNYDTRVPSTMILFVLKEKVLTRMRFYLAGNHEFAVENDLDFILVEHEVPFTFFTVSFSDLSYA